MTKQNQSTPSLSLAVRGHRKCFGAEPRVHLSSTTVDPQTKAQIVRWIAEMGHTQGLVLDALVQFGSEEGFPKSKTPAVRSTGPAGAQLPKPRSVRAKA